MRIPVDSSEVLKAAIDLDAMEAAAIRAGYAVESIQQHNEYMAASLRVVKDQVEAEMASLLRAENIIRDVGEATEGATQQMHNFRFGVANLAAQMQDVAVTAQMGMNPMVIALQQGTQAAAALNASGAGIAGIGGMLKEAFLSIINPVSLVTIGVVAASAATIQWLMSLRGDVKTADQALKEHADLIGQIKERYNTAGEALDEYLKRGPNELAAQTKANVAELRHQLQAESGQLFDNIIERTFIRGPGGGMREWVDGQFKPFEQAIFDLRQSIRDGNPDFETFYATINQKVELEPKLRRAADALASAAQKAGELARNLEQAGAAATTVEDVVSNTFAAIESMQAMRDVSIPELEFGIGQTAEIEKQAQAHKIEMDAIVAKSPAQLADIARRRESLDLADEEISEANRRQQVENAAAEAYASASFAITEATRQRLRAAQDNVAQSQLELDYIGMGIEATTRARFVRQELAQAEEEAAQNGVAVSQSYIDAITKIGDEYGKLQRQIAEKGAISDLMFARSQMGRSETEAVVASSLREIYGDDFAGQMDGFIANQIRVNETLNYFDDIGQSITQNWLTGFVEAWKDAFLDSEADKGAERMKYATQLLDEAMANGTSVTEERRLEIVRLSAAMADAEYGSTALQRAWDSAWKAMGDISIKVLDQLANKALTMAANGIWDMLFTAGMGALGYGGAPGIGAEGLGAIASAFAGGVGNGYAAGVRQAPSGLAWVGERGPELMNFSGGQSVKSNTESMAILAAQQRGGATIYNTFELDARGAQASLAEQLPDLMDSWARQNLGPMIDEHMDNPGRRG